MQFYGDKGEKVMKLDKKYCIGCRDDFYNHDNNSTTGECWMFEKAKVITAYAISWWTPQDKKDNFYKVTTLNCHSEPWQRAFYSELPKHLRGE